MSNKTKVKNQDKNQDLLKKYKISQIFRIENYIKYIEHFYLSIHIFSSQRLELGPEKNLINNIKIIPTSTAKLKFFTV